MSGYSRGRRWDEDEEQDGKSLAECASKGLLDRLAEAKLGAGTEASPSDARALGLSHDMYDTAQGWPGKRLLIMTAR